MLKNDAARRRRQLEPMDIKPRKLVGSDDCICPDGTEEFAEPLRSEFDIAFAERIDALVDEGTIDFVSSVGNVIEVVEFDCSAPVQNRTSVIEVAACDENNAPVSLVETETLAELLMQSLNDLYRESCSPDNLVVNQVTVENPLSAVCQELRLSFNVFFSCYGCLECTNLLADDLISLNFRDLRTSDTSVLLHPLPSKGKRNNVLNRKLVSSTEVCYCDIFQPSSSKVRLDVGRILVKQQKFHRLLDRLFC